MDTGKLLLAEFLPSMLSLKGTRALTFTTKVLGNTFLKKKKQEKYFKMWSAEITQSAGRLKHCTVWPNMDPLTACEDIYDQHSLSKKDV